MGVFSVALNIFLYCEMGDPLGAYVGVEAGDLLVVLPGRSGSGPPPQADLLESLLGRMSERTSETAAPPAGGRRSVQVSMDDVPLSLHLFICCRRLL